MDRRVNRQRKEARKEDVWERKGDIQRRRVCNQITVIFLYYISFRPVTLLKFTVGPLQVSGTQFSFYLLASKTDLLLNYLILNKCRTTFIFSLHDLPVTLSLRLTLCRLRPSCRNAFRHSYF